MSGQDPLSRRVETEGDADARVVLPYLESLGIQPDQIRAQRSFSIRLGRNMIASAGGRAARIGRLDYLVVDADERPLFLVEEKAPNEPLTDEDRDQGISYARLVHPIAPVVLLTNTQESRLYDTITKEEIQSPADAALIRGNGQLSDDDDLRIRTEALEHFVGYSAENVATFSRLQRETRMATLRGTGRYDRKYEPDLYVRRNAARRAMSEFLASSTTVFVVGGQSGLGKTNEMCALAEELGENHLVLFFNGTDLCHQLGAVLADEFNWHFSGTLELPHIMHRLARLADRTGRPVLIVIDAVDEAEVPQFPQELSDLATRLSQFNGQIRLVVSAKRDDWDRFATFRGGPAPIREHIFRTRTGLTSAQESVSIVLDKLDATERDEAIVRYTAAFGLRGEWKPAVRELAADPFMLRVIAEVASAAGAIPDDPGEREIVRRYVDAKLARMSDPNRARRELGAVAAALAGADAAIRPEAHGVPQDAAATVSAVAEATVRARAHISATEPLAVELVAFGVLVAGRDSAGAPALSFAYDRVRDHVLATDVYRFDQLDRAQFHATALTAFPNPLAASVLLWYLPYASPEQWDGFLDAATRQVGRLLDAYEAIRSHIAPAAWRAIEPGGPERVGALFWGLARHQAFGLALFRRVSEAVPRVYVDNPTLQMGHRDQPGRVPMHFIAGAQTRAGFWFLSDPERFAAEHARAQVVELLERGALIESGDEALLAERVVALAWTHRSKLGLPLSRPAGQWALGDDYVARPLFPLDLLGLRRRAQILLGVEVFKGAQLDAQLREEMRAREASGITGGYITTTMSWSQEEETALAERAAGEVDSGRNFVDAVDARGGGELVVLARAVDALLDRRKGRYSLRALFAIRSVNDLHQLRRARHDRYQLMEPLLPAPDAPPRARAYIGGMFEEGYTDAQLARFLEVVFGGAADAYDRVMAVTFSKAFRVLLPSVPRPIVVVCHRQPQNPQVGREFAASVEWGLATPVPHDGHESSRSGTRSSHPAQLPLPRAVAAVGDIHHVGFKRIVTTTAGMFAMEFRELVPLALVVSPHAPPPFVRNLQSGRTAARTAPVRARMYTLASMALRTLTVDDVLSLAASGSNSQFAADTSAIDAKRDRTS